MGPVGARGAVAQNPHLPKHNCSTAALAAPAAAAGHGYGGDGTDAGAFGVHGGSHDVLAGAGTGAAPATQLKKPPTEPQPFSFITDMRCERRRRQQEETEDEDAAEFKALPLNKAILEAPVSALRVPVFMAARRCTPHAKEA